MTSRENGHPGVLVVTMVVVIGTFMAVLDTSILNVALPKLMVLFSVDTKEIQWILTAYMLVSGAVIPIMSYLGDNYGYRALYAYCLAAFTAGSLLCGLAWNNESLIVFRVIQALGGGLIQPASMALMFRFVPKEKMGMAMGLFGLSIAVAPSIGPSLGGFIVEDYSWRWLFMINVPLGVLGFVLCQTLLPETEKRASTHFDFWGLFLSSGSAFLYLLALDKGQDWGWSSYTIVMLLLTATAMGALLVVVELNHPNPMLDLRLFKVPQFTYSVLISSCLYIILIGGVLLWPIYLQNIRGYSAMQTGLILMPQAVAMGLMMPVAGKLYDKIGARPMAMVGIPLIGIATYLMHTLTVDTPQSVFDVWLIIRGLGLGLTFMPVNTAGVSAVPVMKSGAASTLNNLVRAVAGSFGIALTTSLLENRQVFHTHRMVEGLDVFSPSWPAMQQSATGLMAATGDTSPAQATMLTQMYGQIQMHSNTWAMADVFFAFALSVVFVVPMAMLLRRTGGGKGGPSVTAE
ncbi:DHA2 family efflux MFS transporter permease subunit [Heliobacterium gestii]|uniref:DHA2 family efflux MFS transporter permease subunit n=1 Tax=Heliomicrobium gestii TaxID=2699 RepID=A0A845L9B8_HELGE|nr:DHA2 family efflux MFS transporter permease subunit [Heliomicrobium gestii]MBM7867851.1 EmrB/QacA subfamily drug resistance transporter [Heliomicrobium gestii]MZP43337.1 DHA2 family efflux MFS transporter permease subunit [Heliomicrobium gestii]